MASKGSCLKKYKNIFIISFVLSVATALFFMSRMTLSKQPVMSDWRQYITSGNRFVVRFDETSDKFDDSSLYGESETSPMGNLKGGEDYWVKYSLEEGWVVRGFNQGQSLIQTVVYPSNCTSPSNYQLCLWGRRYSYTQKGEVIDSEYGLVGHLIVE